MNYRMIMNCTKRQFDMVIQKEGVTVKDYYDETLSYNVFFRKNNRSTTPQGKVRIFYSQDTPITLGTTFVLKGENYIVISQDAQESDVYYTSLAIKCDTSFTVETEDGWITLPFVTQSDKYGVSSGKVFTVVDGSVICYTGLNKYSKSIKVNQAFYNYGGYYEVGNYFHNNNLCYIYMTRETKPQDNYSLTYEGETTFDISATGTYQLSYLTLNNLSLVENPTLTYESSNMVVATVDNTGLVTFLEPGSTIITTRWIDGGNTTCSTELTISNTAPVVPTMTASINASSNTIKVGGSYKTISMKFYDTDGNDITTDTVANLTATDFVWSHTIDGIEYKDNANVLTIIAGSTVNATKVKFANDRSYLEKIMVTSCTCAALGLTASMEFTIGS